MNPLRLLNRLVQKFFSWRIKITLSFVEVPEIPKDLRPKLINCIKPDVILPSGWLTFLLFSLR